MGSVCSQVWAPSQQSGLTSECPEFFLFLFGIGVGTWGLFFWFVFLNFTTKFALDLQNLRVLDKKIKVTTQKKYFAKNCHFFQSSV